MLGIGAHAHRKLSLAQLRDAAGLDIPVEERTVVLGADLWVRFARVKCRRIDQPGDLFRQRRRRKGR